VPGGNDFKVGFGAYQKMLVFAWVDDKMPEFAA
jgi:hypothetical protein